jgi:hypothetical protein
VYLFDHLPLDGATRDVRLIGHEHEREAGGAQPFERFGHTWQ